MKATKAAVDKFLTNNKIAVAGVSRDPKKMGFQVFKMLKERGYEVYPVNPECDVIQDVPCFRSVSALPAEVQSLMVITSKKHTEDVITQALNKGIGQIWIQQMSDTPEAIELTKNQPVNLVTGECILMHLDPVTGVHKFHKTIRRLFGRMPK